MRGSHFLNDGLCFGNLSPERPTTKRDIRHPERCMWSHITPPPPPPPPTNSTTRGCTPCPAARVFRLAWRVEEPSLGWVGACTEGETLNSCERKRAATWITPPSFLRDSCELLQTHRHHRLLCAQEKKRAGLSWLAVRSGDGVFTERSLRVSPQSRIVTGREDVVAIGWSDLLMRRVCF